MDIGLKFEESQLHRCCSMEIKESIDVVDEKRMKRMKSRSGFRS